MLGLGQPAGILLAFQQALLQDVPAARGHVGGGKAGLDAAPHRLNQQVQHLVGGDALLGEGGAWPATLQQQPEQQVLAADIGVAQQAGLGEGQVDRVVGAGRKALESKHGSTILSCF